MHLRTRHLLMASIAVAAVLPAMNPATAAPQDDPATYWISAETLAGLSGDMAAAIMGGGEARASHALALQLASRTHPAGTAAGDHVVPPALKAGASLPLVGPVRGKGAMDASPTMGQPVEGKARILIYWGCGENPASGSPRIMDARSLASATGVTVRSQQSPSAGTYAGYGEWPNDKNSKPLKADSSLVGSHLVRSNFAPEIAFDLAADQDFMAPLKIGQQKNATGSVALTWGGIAQATGYFLSVMGATKDGDTVIWTSSDVPLSSWMIDDYLPDAEVSRLIGLKAMMPSSARSCTVPAAVMKAVESPLLTVNAFGHETNLAQPRPAAASIGWRPAWYVKLRHRSGTRLMMGQAAEAMAAMQANAVAQREASGGVANREPAKPKKGGFLKSLGRGLMPGL